MSIRETYDLTLYTEDRIERGDYAQDGWHKAIIKEVEENNENASITMEFLIVGGPCDGYKVSERLNHPSMCKDKNAEKIALNHRLIFAKRLSLFKKEDYGTKDVTIDWVEALEQEVAIKVVSRTYTKDGVEKKATGLAFDGIYTLDDKRVPQQLLDEGYAPPEVKENKGTSGNGNGNGSSGGSRKSGSNGGNSLSNSKDAFPDL